MKNWKGALALALILCLLVACSPKQAENTPAPTPTPEATATPEATPESTAELSRTPELEGGEVRVSMLKGPTGLGAAKLMADAQAEKTVNQYEFNVFAEATEAVAALSKGEVDIAAVPTNLAATLYHKLDGGVQLLCLNTGGVLYILENGDTVHSMKDLKGKTIHAFGQGANPEFILNYLLELNGLKAGEDVAVQWYAAADEVTTAMASGQINLCMLPVPAATAVQIQNPDVRSAVSLNDAWTESEGEGAMVMGCLVVRSAFAQEHPEFVNTFLEEYAQSVKFMTDPANADQAAALAEGAGIVPKAAIAKRAIPDASLCCVTGDDMMDWVQGFYEVLFRADPKSIGGSIPDGAFYFQSNP